MPYLMIICICLNTSYIYTRKVEPIMQYCIKSEIIYQFLHFVFIQLTFSFFALCVSVPVLAQARKTRTRTERLILLVSYPLWINGKDRSRNKALLRRDAKILPKKMLPLVTLLIKMFTTYHRILGWSVQ